MQLDHFCYGQTHEQLGTFPIQSKAGCRELRFDFRKTQRAWPCCFELFHQCDDTGSRGFHFDSAGQREDFCAGLLAWLGGRLRREVEASQLFRKILACHLALGVAEQGFAVHTIAQEVEELFAGDDVVSREAGEGWCHVGIIGRVWWRRQHGFAEILEAVAAGMPDEFCK